MNAAMAAAIAAHQAELKQKEEEANKKKKKKGGPAAGGFHSFDSFDAKASQAIAHGKRQRQEVASDDSDSEPDEEDEARVATRVPPVDWSNPPKELLKRAEVAEAKSASKFVAHFIRYIIGVWRESLTDGKLKGTLAAAQMSDIQRSVYEKESSLKETEDMMAPLIQQLEKEAVDAEIMKHLEQMVDRAAEKEYKDAMNSYVELTVGKKKWNNAVMFGEAKHNKGFNARRVKRDEANKFDSDETVQKYVQGLRRVMNFAQLIRPNEDVSKHM